jgi:hypothetical protein
VGERVSLGAWRRWSGLRCGLARDARESLKVGLVSMTSPRGEAMKLSGRGLEEEGPSSSE